MADKKVTIAEVAKRAGVSKATISNYLNKRYDRMKEETKDKIQEAIDALGYIPSISARRLSAKEKSKTVGLIIPGNLANVFDTMYFPQVFDSVGKAAEKQGYSVLIYAQNSKKLGDEQMEYLLGLGKSLVDGFLVFSLTPRDRYFKEFEKNKIPYVCVGKIKGYDDYNYVATDHAQAVKEAVDYLVQLGHEKIAMLTEDKVSVVEESRFPAYKEAMEQHGIPYREDYYYSFSCGEIAENAERVFNEMLQKKERPSAFIIPANLTRYLKRAVRANNLYIPDDLSLITLEYYENYYSEYVTFQNMEYTRVPSVADKVSEVALQKLIGLIEQPEEKFESCLEPIELKIGKTTRVKAKTVN